MFKFGATMFKTAAIASIVIASSTVVSASASTQKGFERVGSYADVASSAMQAMEPVSAVGPPGPRPPPK